MNDLYVSIPAWGKGYIDLATRYTIPALMASVNHWDPQASVHFLIHTDDRNPFRPTFLSIERGCTYEFVKVDGGGCWWGNRERFAPQDSLAAMAFKQAHREAIEWAPQGELLVLLNADIVLSVETIWAVKGALIGNKKVGITTGIRTSYRKGIIGVNANILAQLIWEQRHPVTDECTWGKGHSTSPTHLFFEYDNAVVMHCSHPTPMFIIKDRDLPFNGTIDDDVLRHYQTNEMVYFKDREFMVAELSPPWRGHPCGAPLNVKDVGEFGRHFYQSYHLDLFRQRFKIIGDVQHDHPAVKDIRIQAVDVPHNNETCPYCKKE